MANNSIKSLQDDDLSNKLLNNKTDQICYSNNNDRQLQVITKVTMKTITTKQ